MHGNHRKVKFCRDELHFTKPVFGPFSMEIPAGSRWDYNGELLCKENGYTLFKEKAVPNTTMGSRQ